MSLPLYCIYGNHSFELQRATNTLLAELQPDYSGAEHVKIHCSDIVGNDTLESEQAFERLHDALCSYSLLSSISIVQIHNPELLSAAKLSKKGSKADLPAELKSAKLYASPQASIAHKLTLTPSGDNQQVVPIETIAESAGKSGGRQNIRLLEPWSAAGVVLPSGEVGMVEYLQSLSSSIAILAEEEGGGGASSVGGRCLQLLLEYIESGGSTAVLIFVCQIKKISEIKGSLGKLFESQAKIIRTTITYDDFRATPWIMEECQRAGYRIDRPTAELITEFVGNDLSLLHAEIGKLTLAMESFSKTKVIPKDLVLSCLSFGKSFQIYQITSLLAERNATKILEYLEHILSDKSGEVLALLGLLRSNYRGLLRLAWASGQGMNQKQICEQLKLSAWLYKQRMQLVSAYSLRELENIYRSLGRLEFSLKFSAPYAPTLFKHFCLCIAQRKFDRAAVLTPFSPPANL